MVQHSKYVTFQMAEVAVPRELFVAILEQIQQFGVPPPLVRERSTNDGGHCRHCLNPSLVIICITLKNKERLSRTTSSGTDSSDA